MANSETKLDDLVGTNILNFMTMWRTGELKINSAANVVTQPRIFFELVLNWIFFFFTK